MININLKQEIKLFHEDHVIPQYKIPKIEIEDITISNDYSFAEQVKVTKEGLSFANLPNLSFLYNGILPGNGRVNIDVEKLFVLSENAYNYSHWMLSVLPKFEFLKSTQCLSGNYKILLDRLEPYKIETLNKINIPLENIVEIQEDTVFNFKEIYFTSRYNLNAISPWVFQHLRTLFTPIQKENKNNIYITRKDATRRNIVNEDEVIDYLTNIGFEIFTLDGMTVQEQVNLFANAEQIVSCHGAALTNLVFCKEGTKVLEFVPSDFVNPMYYIMGKQLNLNCHQILVSGSQFEDVAVDIEQLIWNL